MPGRSHDTSAVGRILGRLMLAGVYGSAACLVVGLGIWLLDHDNFAALLLLKTGLIALMATPALRVLTSAVEAIRLKDWLHLATIVLVAVLLALSVTLATRT